MKKIEPLKKKLIKKSNKKTKYLKKLSKFFQKKKSALKK